MIQIADIQWFSLQDYPGVPSAMIFTQGCNLSCKYCHNKQLIPIKYATKQHAIYLGNLLSGLDEKRGKLEGVVITGGEPLIHNYDLIWLLTELKQMGFKVKLDTNGVVDTLLRYILKKKLVDYVAIDIKAPWDKYNKVSEISPAELTCVMASLRHLQKSDIEYEVRTTFDKIILTEDDLKEIKTYFPKDVLHRINECVKAI